MRRQKQTEQDSDAPQSLVDRLYAARIVTEQYRGYNSKLEYQAKRRLYVEAKGVEHEWDDIIQTLTAHLRSIPKRLAPKFTVARPAEEAQKILEEAIDSALLELSKDPDYQPETTKGVQETVTDDPEDEEDLPPTATEQPK